MTRLFITILLSLMLYACSALPYGLKEESNEDSLKAMLQQTLDTLKSLKAQQAPTEPPTQNDEALVLVPRMPVFVYPPEEVASHGHDRVMAQAVKQQKLSEIIMQALEGEGSDEEMAQLQEKISAKVALAIVGGVASGVAGSLTTGILESRGK